MRLNTAVLASYAFFAYCMAIAVARRRRPIRAVLGAYGGIALTAAWPWTQPWVVLHDWVIPPLLMLLSYWTSGALFVAPMTRAEAVLGSLDRALRVRDVAARTPRLVAEYLELSYAVVYPFVPLALAFHVTMTPAPDADRFWAVLLVTVYVCYGMLPWLQTRPPRSLEPEPPWRSSIRAFNRRVLGTASIGVNTCPSGHAAAALAAALMVLHGPPALVAATFVTAAAIGAGAALGRYHYAADVLAGYPVALLVWLVLGR